jgi:hypothetical protein
MYKRFQRVALVIVLSHSFLVFAGCSGGKHQQGTDAGTADPTKSASCTVMVAEPDRA